MQRDRGSRHRPGLYLWKKKLAEVESVTPEFIAVSLASLNFVVPATAVLVDDCSLDGKRRDRHGQHAGETAGSITPGRDADRGDVVDCGRETSPYNAFFFHDPRERAAPPK